MRFKKIYIEITNCCNLKCSFCIGNSNTPKHMNLKDFKYIIDNIKDYTKEVYFHILGESLMHKNINDFIEYASSQNLLVNITTNGYMIKKIANNPYIHRLNISIHSFDPKYGLSLEEYLNNIFYVIDKLHSKTFIALRLWVNSEHHNEILAMINNHYKTNIKDITNNTKTKITKNIIIDTFHEFIWPDLNNNYYCETGTCYGLINHIGILVDGRVIPCCLDANGILTLGNIYQENLNDILNKSIVKDMITGFKKNYKYQELCKHCSFLEKK